MKVRAANENIQKYIKHPLGTKFNREGVADWPDDQFTRRRVRDGDITIVKGATAVERDAPMPDSVIGRAKAREQKAAHADRPHATRGEKT